MKKSMVYVEGSGGEYCVESCVPSSSSSLCASVKSSALHTAAQQPNLFRLRAPSPAPPIEAKATNLLAKSLFQKNYEKTNGLFSSKPYKRITATATNKHSERNPLCSTETTAAAAISATATKRSSAAHFSLLSASNVLFALIAFTIVPMSQQKLQVASGSSRFLLMRSPSRDSPDGISQLFLLHKPRMRRSKPACTVDDYSKPGVQEAVFKMIIGSKSSDLAPLVRQMSKAESGAVRGGPGSCSEDIDHNGGGGLKLGFEISPDMPLEMRAVCGFDYEENVNERRIPRAIREVKCLCKVPQQTEGIRCEPVYNDVPVLIFDETCTNFREQIQPIAFACVPVLTSQSQTNFAIGIANGQKMERVIR